MALIRGINGLCPCPVCLVPSKEQQNITKQFPLRTADHTKKVIEEMKSKRTEAEKDELLKGYGIRAVSVNLILLLLLFLLTDLKGLNAFFDLANSDPFKALSVDRMHSSAHGLGGKHIWPVIQEYIEKCGREHMKAIDER